MSKLQKTETNLHVTVSQPNPEQMSHPRKTSPVETKKKEEKKQESESSTTTEEEVKGSQGGSRHPSGHKVKDQEEVLTSAHKTKFLPLSDSLNCGDLYFQPHSVSAGGKNILTVMVEELFNGNEMVRDMHEYSIAADDLLKMLYLAEKMQNTFFCTETEEFDLWLVHKYSTLLAECRNLEMGDHGAIAEKLLMMHKEWFVLGKGTMFEVYFQKRCIHEYTGAKAGVENPNVFKCKAPRAKFEYEIEARVFVLNEQIHERKIGDMFPESQIP